MLTNVLKLSINWAGNHKLRYALGCIPFAIISAMLVICLSFGQCSVEYAADESGSAQVSEYSEQEQNANASIARDYQKEYSDILKFMAVVFGIGLSVLAGVALINISLSIAEENLPFLRMLNLLGIRERSFKSLMGCMIIFQGLIGTVIGCLLSVSCGHLIQQFFEYLMGEDYQLITFTFTVDHVVVILVALFDIIVSVICCALITRRVRTRLSDEI